MKELNGLPLHTSALGSEPGGTAVGCLMRDGGRVIVFMFSALSVGPAAVLFSSSSGKDGKVSPRAVRAQELNSHSRCKLSSQILKENEKEVEIMIPLLLKLSHRDS